MKNTKLWVAWNGETDTYWTVEAASEDDARDKLSGCVAGSDGDEFNIKPAPKEPTELDEYLEVDG